MKKIKKKPLHTKAPQHSDASPLKKAPHLPDEFYQLAGLLDSTQRVVRQYLLHSCPPVLTEAKKTAAALHRLAPVKDSLLDAEAHLTLTLMPVRQASPLKDEEVSQAWLQFEQKVTSLIGYAKTVLKDFPGGFWWSLDIHVRLLQDCAWGLERAIKPYSGKVYGSWPSFSSSSSWSIPDYFGLKSFISNIGTKPSTRKKSKASRKKSKAVRKR